MSQVAPEILSGEVVLMFNHEPVVPTKELIETLLSSAILADGVAVVEVWSPANTYYGDDHARTIGTLVVGKPPEGVGERHRGLYERSFSVWPDGSRPEDRDSQGKTGSLAAPRAVPYGDDAYVLRFHKIADATGNSIEPVVIYYQ